MIQTRGHKLRAQLCLVLVLAWMANASFACQVGQAKGGKCFALRGRVYLSNGTPSMRISPVGSGYILGVLPAENEDAPESIKHAVTFDQSVRADMVVCPLSPAKAGAMQMVCIRSASNMAFENQ